MIYNLLYHRTLGSARAVTSINVIREQFAYIACHYDSIFPGQHPSKSGICIIFDDGYVDFYYLIYPLLKEFKLKAVLAPITSYIKKTSTQSKVKRLEALANFESLDKESPQDDIYCTIDEIQEMISSGLVKIACHSHSHKRLNHNSDLVTELIYSKHLLENIFSTQVDSFIFPMGKVDKQVVSFAKNHFLYLFRIGSSIHFKWSKHSQLYCRICCDNITSYKDPFFIQKKFKYFAKYILHKLKF